MIDGSNPPDEQWQTIDAELEAYGEGLNVLPQIVVLNKSDLVPNPEFTIDDPRIIALFNVSCATGFGIDDFRKRLFSLVPEDAVVVRSAEDVPDYLVYRPKPKTRTWRLFRTDRGFRIVGTPPPEAELEAALKAAGAKKGAEVEVDGESFELV